MKNVNKMNCYEKAEYYNTALKTDIFSSIDDFEYLNNKYAYANIKDEMGVFVDRNGKYYTIEDLLEAVETGKTLSAYEKESLKDEIDYLNEKIDELNDEIYDLNNQINYLERS